MELRLGRYQDVLGDVTCDAVIADPPYSARTHEGHDDGASLANRPAVKAKYRGVGGTNPRTGISYDRWDSADVAEFVKFWAPRNRGWFVCLSDSDLCQTWRWAFEAVGLTGFQPIPCVLSGMTVRLSGDGPSSWAVYANVARPKALSKWGTLPGAYQGPPGEREHIGGKPLWLMRALIRDYTKPGDLICDPTAGAATTLIAAGQENRKAIGAEVDPATHAKAMKRLARGYTPSFDFGGAA
jgi:site-specific DNA-methyltransferase (adenine-specific)